MDIKNILDMFGFKMQCRPTAGLKIGQLPDSASPAFVCSRYPVASSRQNSWKSPPQPAAADGFYCPALQTQAFDGRAIKNLATFVAGLFKRFALVTPTGFKPVTF